MGHQTSVIHSHFNQITKFKNRHNSYNIILKYKESIFLFSSSKETAISLKFGRKKWSC